MNVPITYSKIYIEIPADVLQISSMEITEELNEHGIAHVHLLTEDKNEYAFLDDLKPDTNVKLVTMEGEEPKILFIGIPVKIAVKSIKHIFHVDLTLKSKSFEMDCEKKRRSFQNKDNLLKNIFTKVVEEDNFGKVFDTATNGAVQEESIIQYDETDWQFIKRLASKKRAKIVTDVTKEIPIMTIGKQIGFDHLQDTNHYTLAHDAEGFLKAQLNYGEWMPEQKKQYTIESIHNYRLYDKLLYEELVFTVVKKKTHLKNDILVFTYWIMKGTGVRQDMIVNENIRGVSINSIVLDVLTDRVKLHLSIDKTQSVEEAFWYKCETAYTAKGSTGFYAMPQKGDNVKLYFPKSHVEDGYVRMVNRMDGPTNSKTQDPSVKYFGNIDKKELMLAPSELQMTAINGMLLINMDDKQGIEICSDGNIVINSSEALVTGGKIAFRAGEEIRLATKSSSITVDTLINIKADGGVSGI